MKVYSINFTFDEPTEGNIVCTATDSDEAATKLTEFFESNGFHNIVISEVTYLGEEENYIHPEQGSVN